MHLMVFVDLLIENAFHSFCAKKGFATKNLMLNISFFNLAHNALNSLGFLKENL